MNIIKAEFYKLGKAKLFFVCLCLCVVLGSVATVAMKLGIGQGDDLAETTFSGVEMIGFALDIGTPIPQIIIALFIAFFAANEFQSGAIKNYISKGVSRTGLYLSKLAVCGMAALVLLIGFMASACVTGTISLGFDPLGVATFSNVATMVFSELLLMLGLASVSVFFSIWLRNFGASIVASILMVALLPMILPVFDYFLGGGVMLSNYWIPDNITALATLVPASGAVLRGVIVALCYLVGGTILGCVLLKKQDIK
jgi:ABC-type transport system involved in multi-copper enzyme maturation permease subunit